MDRESMNNRAALIAERRHRAEQATADQDFAKRVNDTLKTLGAPPVHREYGEPTHSYANRAIGAALERVATVPHMEPSWLGMSIGPTFDDATAKSVANITLDAAEKAFTAPIGELREAVSRDSAGREVHRFYGDPEACWGQFKQKSRVVTEWSTPRGADAAGATPGHLMPDGSFRATRL